MAGSILTPSAWAYKTSSGIGASGGVGAQVGFTTGQIQAYDPQGPLTHFSYAAGGAGVGLGGKIQLPNLGPFQSVLANIAGSTLNTPSGGLFYLTANMNGNEAAPADMRGPCFIAEIAAGYGGGVAVTAVFMGCNAAFAGPPAASGAPQGAAVIPPLCVTVMVSAKVVLLMAALNVGPQIGVGAMGYFGTII
jgi:hypothetical protein